MRAWADAQTFRQPALSRAAANRVTGQGKGVQEEIARVEGTGGWISDGRVCDILAVSRAFGDTEFKGEGLKALLATGVECAPHPPPPQDWLVRLSCVLMVPVG